MTLSVLLVFLALSTGSNPNPALNDAVHRYERGEFKQALDLFLQLKSKMPDDPEVRHWTGKTYLKTRDWDKAVREMEKTVELEPANAKHHLWLGRAYGARASHIVFFKAMRLAGRVVKAFEKARDLAPDSLDIRFDLIDYYLNAPGFLGGGKDKAENEIRVINKLDPKMGYIARASLYIKDEQWEQARKELLRGTTEYPNDPDMYKDLAGFLLERGDFAGARDYAGKALALKPKSKRTLLILAAAQTRLNTDLDEAASSLRALAAGPLRDGDPSFEDVYYWLGECYLAGGDKAQALDAFTSALRYNPENEKAKKRVSKLK